MDKSSIVIFQAEDGSPSIDVRLENETVWLSQQQMAELFQVDRTVIGRHIKNIIATNELNEQSTCAFFAHVRKEGVRIVRRKIPSYNLDMIISVGYRVNSKRGTQFRIWANKLIKEYIVNGYVISNNLVATKYEELSQLVRLLGRTIKGQIDLNASNSEELVNIVSDYTYALDTLDRYDYQSLCIEKTTQNELFHATYENAIDAITTLKEKFGGSELFAREKDGSFKSSIGQIYQTWEGKDLYPSVEEKAAMLLYLVIKNHSFSDGNKRIAATLFIWFLQNNGILYNDDGTKRISDGALVSITLMIAESKMEEREMMVKVIVNLINGNNR